MNKTIIIFRYDDYHAKRGKQDSVKDEIENEFLDIFAKEKIFLTLSAIPNYGEFLLSKDKNKIDILNNLLDKNLIEVALHGFNHHVERKDMRRAGEFKGVDFNLQFEKIKKGKKILEECLHTKIKTFIPPFNAYDKNTLKVLERLNFSCLSNSRLGPFYESKMTIIPNTCSFAELDNFALSAATNENDINFIVVMFHYFSFFDSKKKWAIKNNISNFNLKDLKNLLKKCKKHSEILTFGQVVEQYKNELKIERINNSLIKNKKLFI
ncbi:MAG: DUF2334 domain-containing protein [Bacteroidetes bacterium]|nr:DUF2334 domain-containing protein [Bacteroidota bacterium]